jgi:ATP-dependent RNA helicase RhlE
VRAERVAKAMERANIKSITLHGDKDQSDRFTAMDQFKNGSVKLLIATDISARGIDFPNIDYVVNYDLPDQAENYVHRVGRTGRGTQKGHAVSFCSPEEKAILKEIESFLDKPIDVLEIDKTTYSETLEFTEDTNYNWKALLDDEEKTEKESKNKKRRKK